MTLPNLFRKNTTCLCRKENEDDDSIFVQNKFILLMHTNVTQEYIQLTIANNKSNLFLTYFVLF
jgi:hypothetical protein